MEEGRAGIQELKFTDDQVTGALARMVESMLIQWLGEHHFDVLKRYYPDIDDGPFQITCVRTRPQSPLPMGHTSRDKISGWHGDLVFLHHCKTHRTRALIIEIKFGEVCISQSQHKFFQKVVRQPGDFYKGLTEAKVVILHAFNFCLDKGTIEVRFEDYHSPMLFSKKYFKKMTGGYKESGVRNDEGID